MLEQAPIPAATWTAAPGDPARGGRGWAQDLLDHAGRTAVLDYDLGRIDLGEQGVLSALGALSEARARALYGFSFHLTVTKPLTPDQASVLAAAGATSVTVALTQRSVELQNARAVQSVRALADHNIAPRWTLVADGLSTSALEALASALVHLPPPETIGDRDGQHRAVLATWRAAHAPQALSYARGPGFLRVLDRRRGDRNWRFVVLNEMQAQILLACRVLRRIDTLAADFGLGQPDARSLVDALAANGLVLATACGRAVSLVPRRQFSERWASGDH